MRINKLQFFFLTFFFGESLNVHAQLIKNHKENVQDSSKSHHSMQDASRIKALALESHLSASYGDRRPGDVAAILRGKENVGRCNFGRLRRAFYRAVLSEIFRFRHC